MHAATLHNNGSGVQSHTALPSILEIIATCMLLLAIATGTYLYQSFGSTVFERIIYGAFGFFFVLLGGIMPMLAHQFAMNRSYGFSIVTWITWVLVCFALGTQTHLGFFALSHSQLENQHRQDSTVTQLYQQKIAESDATLKQYADGANINRETIQADIDALEKNAMALQNSLNACPANYLKNCRNPILASQEENNRKLSDLREQLNAHAMYTMAMKNRTEALQGLQTGKGITGDEFAHPLFIVQGQILGITPHQAKSFFLAYSAIAYEMIVALLFYWSSVLRGSRTFTVMQPNVIDANAYKVDSTKPAELPVDANAYKTNSTDNAKKPAELPVDANAYKVNSTKPAELPVDANAYKTNSTGNAKKPAELPVDANAYKTNSTGNAKKPAELPVDANAYKVDSKKPAELPLIDANELKAGLKKSTNQGNASLVLTRFAEVLDTKNDAQLARKLEVSPSTISGWRRRDVLPYAKAKELAEKHKVSLDNLLIGA